MSLPSHASTTLESNIRALTIFTSYLTICTTLTLSILYSMYKAHRQLKASNQSFDRSSLIVSTTGAAISFQITWHAMLSFFTLSYQSWAFGNGIPPPPPGDWWFNTVYLGDWLKDVQLFREAWETVVETPARVCWSLPIFFVTAAWSLYIAKHAQTRRIKHVWMFMVLGQLVAISFAVNLFYASMLLHPEVEGGVMDKNDGEQSGQSGKQLAKKADRGLLWTPPASFYSAFIPLVFVSIHCTTMVAGDKYFLLYLAVPHLMLLVPPMLGQIMPRRRGVIHGTKSAYNDFYDTWIKGICWAGLVLEVLWIYVALTGELRDDRHVHRHSNVQPYKWQGLLDTIGETKWQSVWRALHDHPAVKSVGCDSLLCLATYFFLRPSQFKQA